MEYSHPNTLQFLLKEFRLQSLLHIHQFFCGTTPFVGWEVREVALSNFLFYLHLGLAELLRSCITPVFTRHDERAVWLGREEFQSTIILFYKLVNIYTKNACPTQRLFVFFVNQNINIE